MSHIVAYWLIVLFAIFASAADGSKSAPSVQD